MADTLDRLLEHHGPGARGVVWAHNTHVGDARATDMATAGMVNLGQLARERHGDDEVVLVGFGSHHGSVVAGSYWGADAEVMAVPDAPPGTHEDLLDSAVGGPALVVWPADVSELAWARSWRGHRAIGVVYHPDRDRFGNWVPSVLGERYDAFLHLPETAALRPLPASEEGRELETAPWGT